MSDLRFAFHPETKREGYRGTSISHGTPYPDFRIGFRDRRISGGNPAAAPSPNRWPTARLPAVQPAALPPANPFQMPGNFRAFARQFLGRLPAPAQLSTRSLPMTRRRPTG